MINAIREWLLKRLIGKSTVIVNAKVAGYGIKVASSGKGCLISGNTIIDGR